LSHNVSDKKRVNIQFNLISNGSSLQTSDSTKVMTRIKKVNPLMTRLVPEELVTRQICLFDRFQRQSNKTKSAILQLLVIWTIKAEASAKTTYLFPWTQQHFSSVT